MDEEDPPLSRPDDWSPADRHVRSRSAARIAPAVRDSSVSNFQQIAVYFILFILL